MRGFFICPQSGIFKRLNNHLQCHARTLFKQQSSTPQDLLSSNRLNIGGGGGGGGGSGMSSCLNISLDSHDRIGFTASCGETV